MMINEAPIFVDDWLGDLPGETLGWYRLGLKATEEGYEYIRVRPHNDPM